MPTSRVSKTKKPGKKTTSRTKIASLEAAMKQAADHEDTAAAEGQDSPDSPLYFWRETDAHAGYLSQWYHCPFRDDQGKTYKTAEHYMMHHKALLFNDSAMAVEILKAGHPRKVKGLGRKVSNFDEAVWNENRERIVRQGNYLKFTCAVSEDGIQLGNCATAPLVGMSLRDLLLSTGDRELVEASPYDSIWGVGFTAEKASQSREHWGLNLLGKALMEVREMFRNEDVEKAKANGIA